MLTIDTYLAPSPVHGIGLYTAQPLAAGTVIWRFHRGVDRVLAPAAFLAWCRSVSPQGLRHILSSSYRRNGRYFYLTDNARFINHCPEGENVALVDDYTEVTLRDIARGEELLEDYGRLYDPQDYFFQEMLAVDPCRYLACLQQPPARHAPRPHLS